MIKRTKKKRNHSTYLEVHCHFQVQKFSKATNQQQRAITFNDDGDKEHNTII